MFVLGLVLVLVNLEWSNTGYVEIVETSGCYSCKVMLTCRRLTSVIAILEAEFSTDVRTLPINSRIKMNISSFSPVSLRDALNHRCSGVNHCSFIFTEDCPGSENVGSGNISVKYACITEDRIKKYCNTDIQLQREYGLGISDGFIHNPGYPRFYSGQRECRWRITAQAPQKIRVTLLDVSLIVDNVPSPFDCTDVLEVKDTGQVIHSSCHQEQPPTEVLSAGESLEIVLNSKSTFNPRRGVLVYYTLVGCPELRVPQDAYVVYRKRDLVVLSCCLGYLFPDTGTRIKSVRCIGAYWNTSLPLANCQKYSKELHFNRTGDVIIRKKEFEDMASDLIPPILIILLLFTVNGVILFFIHKAKKKQELENIREEEEELGTLTSTHETEA